MGACDSARLTNYPPVDTGGVPLSFVPQLWHSVRCYGMHYRRVLPNAGIRLIPQLGVCTPTTDSLLILLSRLGVEGFLLPPALAQYIWVGEQICKLQPPPLKS